MCRIRFWSSYYANIALYWLDGKLSLALLYNSTAETELLGHFQYFFGKNMEESVRMTFPKDISYIELGADSFVSYKKWSHDS